MGLVVLLVLVVVFGWLMLATIGLAFGLLLTLLVAGLVGWAADMVVPGELPGGWDRNSIRAAVTLALDAAMPAMIEELTERVLLSLTLPK